MDLDNLAKVVAAAAQSNRSMIALIVVIVGTIVVKIFAPSDKVGVRIFAFLAVFLTALGLFAWAVADEKKALENKIIAAAHATQVHILSREYDTAQKDLASLSDLAPGSGHNLYFQGELKRVSRPSRSLSSPNVITAIDWFVRYLDDKRSNATLESTRMDAQSCYESAEGFCRQRGGWIAHLLANIFYGLSLEQSSQRRDYLEKAQKYVQLSVRYYPDGFAASIPEPGGADDKYGTTQLAKLIQDGLTQR